MGTLRRYVEGASALAGQALITRLIGMVTNVVLARGLGAAELGTYSAVMNTGSSAYGLVRFGTDAGVHVLTAETQSPTNRFSRSDILAAGFLLLSVSGCIGAVACYAMASFLAEKVYGSASLSPWLTAASAIVVAQCIGQFFYAALAGLHKFGRYAVASVAGAAIGLILLLAGIWIGQLKGAVAAAISAQWLTTLGLAAAFLWRRSPRSPAQRSGFPHLTQACAEILRLGFPFYLAGLLSLPVYYVAQGALAQSAGLEAVGYLRIIVAVTSIITFVPASVAAATVSTLTSVRTDSASGHEQFGYLALLNLRVVWVFSLTAALFTYSLMPAIIYVLFGDAYRSAVAPARVAVLTAALTTIVNAASHGYFAARRVDRIFWQVALQTVVFLVFAATLIPTQGVMGYVSADLAAYAAICLVVVVISIQLCKAAGLSAIPIGVLCGISFCSIALLWHLAAEASVREMDVQLICLLVVAASSFGCWRWALEPAERESSKAMARRFRNLFLR